MGVEHEIEPLDAHLIEELIRSVGLRVDQVFALAVELPGTLVIEYHKMNAHGKFYASGGDLDDPRIANGREIRRLIWNRA